MSVCDVLSFLLVEGSGVRLEPFLRQIFYEEADVQTPDRTPQKRNIIVTTMYFYYFLFLLLLLVLLLLLLVSPSFS